MTKIHTRKCALCSGITAERDERDERHAGHAVGLEAVGGRADRVAGVVAGAVGDHAGVARIVLLDLEHDLHQVRADVGDLGEDAARDAQRRGAERLADREAQEAGARRSRASTNSRIASIMISSTQISSTPMLMPAWSGIS